MLTTGACAVKRQPLGWKMQMADCFGHVIQSHGDGQAGRVTAAYIISMFYYFDSRGRGIWGGPCGWNLRYPPLTAAAGSEGGSCSSRTGITPPLCSRMVARRWQASCHVVSRWAWRECRILHILIFRWDRGRKSATTLWASMAATLVLLKIIAILVGARVLIIVRRLEY